ncbi:MAG: hypothetical protein KC503_33160 [Myxococcales bacterium]|nr:hypothetical protein [Myxococcales bacterium]
MSSKTLSKSRTHTVVALSLLAFVLVAFGCEQKKQTKDRLYFDDLKLPIGAKAKIISDVNLNPAGTTSVQVVGVVPKKIDRDDLGRLMRSLWRQVKRRKGFRGKGTPDKIDIRLYTSEAQAKAGGTDWLGQVLRVGQTAKVTYTNRQKLPLLKYAKKAIGKLPQYSGTLKPQFLADADTMELEVKVPFVASDGTGQYLKKLSYTTLTTTFSSWTRTLFEKIPKLRKLTFEGKHDDEVVVRIWMTREQYEQLNLRQVEEGINAYRGKFVNRMLDGNPRTAKMVEKKAAKKRKKVYREVFARLPKEQVQLAKKYR